VVRGPCTLVFNKLELPWVTVLVPNIDFYPVIGRYLNDRPFPNEVQGCFGPISDGPRRQANTSRHSHVQGVVLTVLGNGWGAQHEMNRMNSWEVEWAPKNKARYRQTTVKVS
jgi:hypothetical protein